MDVFVIPVANGRYELYCEPAADPHPEPDEADEDAEGTASWMSRWRHRLSWARWRRRVAGMLSALEHRQTPAAGHESESGSWMGRQQERMSAWIAERVAEQRLLWNLRSRTAAVAVHPSDMTFEQVQALVTHQLQIDLGRHRKWFVIDAVLMVLSWPLTIVPGPNVLLFYFMLRAGGHWFSMQGARQGLRHVTWSGRSCPSLSELRDIAGLEPAAREQRVHDIAVRLQIPHFSTFFARVAQLSGG